MERFVFRERIVRVDRVFRRFGVLHRLEHGVLLLSVTVLLLTGMPQKYVESGVAQVVIDWLGGIERARLVHRAAALALLAIAMLHIAHLLYRLLVLRRPPHALAFPSEIKIWWRTVRYRLGFDPELPDMGRFTPQEKLLYWATVWNIFSLGTTGLIMWKPVIITRIFPGQVIPAAKAAHGAEALLLVFVGLLWHLWHVLGRQWNFSIFTGTLPEEAMIIEHPLEWKAILEGVDHPPLDLGLMRKRRYTFLTLAIMIVVILGGMLTLYIDAAPTAIRTRTERALPTVEIVNETLLVTATPPANLPAPTWAGQVEDLFADNCVSCHAEFADYDSLLDSGVITPGDPRASTLLAIQSSGDHPGQFTPDEMATVITWIQQEAVSH